MLIMVLINIELNTKFKYFLSFNCKYLYRYGNKKICTLIRIYYVADAAYAAGLVLIGASRFTVPRPLPEEHAHFL